MTDGVHTLYRAFNGDGELLYVGITGRGIQRGKRHARSSEWWADAHAMTFEHFETREECIAAETKAIAEERPLFNVKKTTVRSFAQRPRMDPIKRVEQHIAIQSIFSMCWKVLQNSATGMWPTEGSARGFCNSHRKAVEAYMDERYPRFHFQLLGGAHWYPAWDCAPSGEKTPRINRTIDAVGEPVELKGRRV